MSATQALRAGVFRTPIKARPEIETRESRFWDESGREPEYRLLHNGKGKALTVVLNVDQSSGIPLIAGPLLFWSHTDLSREPSTPPDDLAKAGRGIAEAARKRS